jgi:hypothetical protein
MERDAGKAMANAQIHGGGAATTPLASEEDAKP